jgi:hypothetical protein
MLKGGMPKTRPVSCDTAQQLFAQLLCGYRVKHGRLSAKLPHKLALYGCIVLPLRLAHPSTQLPCRNQIKPEHNINHPGNMLTQYTQPPSLTSAVCKRKTEHKLPTPFSASTKLPAQLSL